MSYGTEGAGMSSRTTRRRPVTCADCYFRCEGLCALPGDDPCPTPDRESITSAKQLPKGNWLVRRNYSAD